MAALRWVPVFPARAVHPAAGHVHTRGPDMAEDAAHDLKRLEQLRDYLRLFARPQIDPRLRANVDPSGVVIEALKGHQARGNFD